MFYIVLLSLHTISLYQTMTQSTLKEIYIAIKKHLLYDKSVWKWCIIFTGINFSAYLFFNKIYYPLLIKSYSPKSFGISYYNIAIKSGVSTAFPQSLLSKSSSFRELYDESLYSRYKFWFNSKKAAGRFMSTCHAVLTVYNGLNCMNKLGITSYAISQGVDFIQPSIKTDHPLVLNVINMNMGYAIADIIIKNLPTPKNDMVFQLHHIMILCCGMALKYFNEGAPCWLLGYVYADIPTFIQHSAWFVKNRMDNLNVFKDLFNLESVKNGENVFEENEFERLENRIMKRVKVLNKTNRSLYLIWAILFLYVRCGVYTKVIPSYLWNSLQSDKFGLKENMILMSCQTIMIGIGYWWSYKLILKLQKELTKSPKIKDNLQS